MADGADANKRHRRRSDTRKEKNIPHVLSSWIFAAACIQGESVDAGWAPSSSVICGFPAFTSTRCSGSSARRKFRRSVQGGQTFCQKVVPGILTVIEELPVGVPVEVGVLANPREWDGFLGLTILSPEMYRGKRAGGEGRNVGTLV